MKESLCVSEHIESKPLQYGSENEKVPHIFHDYRIYQPYYPPSSTSATHQCNQSYCHDYARSESINSLQVLSSFYHNQGQIYPNLPQNFIALPTHLNARREASPHVYEPYNIPGNFLNPHVENATPSMTSTESCCDTTTDTSETRDANSIDSKQSASWTYRRRSERWTIEEHEIFKKAIKKHGRNWKMIKNYLPTRSLTQVRTHAYWYIAKEQRRNFDKANQFQDFSTTKTDEQTHLKEENLVGIAEAITMLHSNLTSQGSSTDNSSTDLPNNEVKTELRRRKKRKNIPVVSPPNLRHLLKIKI